MDQDVKKVFPTTMVHWNRNVGCVIDTETTGLIPGYHEIVQIACIPFNSNFEVVQEIPPFICVMRPDYPERIDPQAMKVNKKAEAMAAGVSQIQGSELFEQWFDQRLGIYANKYGNANRIIPLGHNFCFDKAFMQAWLGPENYERFFHYHYRDTMHAALYMNDFAGMHVMDVPFPKVSLGDVLKRCKLETPLLHDAVQDCLSCLGVYRTMCKNGLPTVQLCD